MLVVLLEFLDLNIHMIEQELNCDLIIVSKRSFFFFRSKRRVNYLKLLVFFIVSFNCLVALYRCIHYQNTKRSIFLALMSSCFGKTDLQLFQSCDKILTSFLNEIFLHRIRCYCLYSWPGKDFFWKKNSSSSKYQRAVTLVFFLLYLF